MTKKNHHFVPQFYLRNFSSTDRSIHLVNIQQARAIETAGIAGQCYRRKFYGETNELEDLLSIMEGYASTLFKVIIKGGAVPKYSRDHRFLLDYVAVQMTRTRRAIEYVNRLASLQMTYILNEHLAREDHGGEDSRVVFTFDNTFPLKFAEDLALGMMDLDYRVLRSTCDARFITSDVPVVSYNQWCEGVDFTGVLGISSRGLQIFLPISPTCVLLLFDPYIYSLGGDSDGNVLVNRPADIFAINRLQSVFAQENLYFSEWAEKERILAALPKIANMRQNLIEKIDVAREIKPLPNAKTTSEITHEYVPMPNTHLTLSFSNIRRQARKVPLDARAHQWRYKDLSRFRNAPPPDEEAEKRLAGKTFRVRQRSSWEKSWGNTVP